MLAPPQGSSTSYGFQAGTVTASVATDSGPVSSKPTYLDIGPTPVIFVHGLWANAATFDEMRTNLGFAQPWQTFLYKYGVLTAMCYDATVPFDFGGPDPSTAGPPPSNAYVTAHRDWPGRPMARRPLRSAKPLVRSRQASTMLTTLADA